MGEGKNNTRKKHKDSHTLTSYTQGWAPMHLPSGGQRELRWKKKKSTLEYIYSVRLPLTYRTEKSRHCHMNASSHNSVHLSSWPKSHWATSKETGRTAPARQSTAFRWTLGDIYRVRRLTYCEETRAVPTLQNTITQTWAWVSLIIVKPNFSLCQLIMAVKGKRRDWPEIITDLQGPCLTYELRFYCNLPTIHFFSDLKVM